MSGYIDYVSLHKDGSDEGLAPWLGIPVPLKSRNFFDYFSSKSR
jgi:hypothetical protein